MVRLHRFFDGAQRGVTINEERHHHAGEQNRVADREDGQFEDVRSALHLAGERGAVCQRGADAASAADGAGRVLHACLHGCHLGVQAAFQDCRAWDS